MSEESYYKKLESLTRELLVWEQKYDNLYLEDDLGDTPDLSICRCRLCTIRRKIWKLLKEHQPT